MNTKAYVFHGSSNTRKVCAVCAGVSTLYQNVAFDPFTSVRHKEICAFSYVLILVKFEAIFNKNPFLCDIFKKLKKRQKPSHIYSCVKKALRKTTKFVIIELEK